MLSSNWRTTYSTDLHSTTTRRKPPMPSSPPPLSSLGEHWSQRTGGTSTSSTASRSSTSAWLRARTSRSWRQDQCRRAVPLPGRDVVEDCSGHAHLRSARRADSATRTGAFGRSARRAAGTLWDMTPHFVDDPASWFSDRNVRGFVSTFLQSDLDLERFAEQADAIGWRYYRRGRKMVADDFLGLGSAATGEVEARRGYDAEADSVDISIPFDATAPAEHCKDDLGTIGPHRPALPAR